MTFRIWCWRCRSWLRRVCRDWPEHCPKCGDAEILVERKG